MNYDTLQDTLNHRRSADVKARTNNEGDLASANDQRTKASAARDTGSNSLYMHTEGAGKLNVDIEGVVVHHCDEAGSSAVLVDPEASMSAAQRRQPNPLMGITEHPIRLGSQFVNSSFES
jgi:hypothetical protein